MKDSKKPIQKFFQIYLDTEDIVNLLSDEDRGKLFSMLFRFAKNGETPIIEDDPALAIAFKMFSAQIERDFAAYDRKVSVARENGKRGGAPKNNRNAAKQPKTTKTTENKQEEEKEEEKEKDKEEEEEKKTSAKADGGADADDVIILFDRICPDIPNTCSPERLRGLIPKARSALGNVGFEEYFSRISRSDFLTGRNGKWNGCTLEWLLNPKTIEKVLCGVYDDRKPPRTSSYDIEKLEEIDRLEFI